MGTILIPLLTAHLLLVNVAMAGPFVCVWLDWRGCRREDRLADETGKRLARDVFWSLLWATVIGGLMVALLWWKNDQAYFDAVWAIPDSRLWFAAVELTFSLALLGGYAYCWDSMRKRRFWHRVMAILSGLNLAYHFPPMFSAISYIADHPELRIEPIGRDVFRRLLVDRAVVSMAVHVWLASAAVVGVLLLWFALKYPRSLQQPNELNPPALRLAGWGSWMALIPTVLQLFAGIWVVVELPASSRDALLGNRLPLTLLFGTGILAALRLMHVLASIALGDRTPRQLVSAIATMLLTVLLMTATLHVSSRREELNPNPTFSTSGPGDQAPFARRVSITTPAVSGFLTGDSPLLLTSSYVARNDLAVASVRSQDQPAPGPGL